jgi:MerR family transcriptional regulator, copper efflux regulator
MLISEFSRATGLTLDTVRFYIRRGLLTPETNGKGGRNPYQIFTAEHVRAARIIRMAQTLGMSLKEIGAINDELRDHGISDDRSVEIMSDQLHRIEKQVTELEAIASYLRTKIDWLKSGKKGAEPDLGDFGSTDFEGTCE